MAKGSIATKSVGTPAEAKDGLRVLVTRYRGRGMPKSRYDLWLPSLGPSEELLAEFLDGKITWAKFSGEYRRELWLDGGADERNHTVKNHGQKGLLRTLKYLARKQRVTLLCHCDEDAKHCHRHLLRQTLLSPKVTL
jgi:uncharacterized protein YeaO (DUF488 family)